MRLQTFIIGAIVFTAIITGLFASYAEAQTRYNNTINESRFERYNVNKNLSAVTTGAEASAVEDQFGQIESQTVKQVSTGKAIFGAFGTIKRLLPSLQSDLQIPPVFITAFISVVTLVGVIAFYRFIRKGEG